MSSVFKYIPHMVIILQASFWSTSSGVIVGKLNLQTFMSEYGSIWVPHLSKSFVNYNKLYFEFLSKISVSFYQEIFNTFPCYPELYWCVHTTEMWITLQKDIQGMTLKLHLMVVEIWGVRSNLLNIMYS